MPAIETTGFVIGIEPRMPTPEYDFGPLDNVSSNAVMLTADNLKKCGGYACRAGHDWQCLLWIWAVVDGVPDDADFRTTTMTGSYWDPVSREAVALTLVIAGNSVKITIADDGGHVAGMYRFLIVATIGGLVYDLCSGWLEILPATPTP